MPFIPTVPGAPGQLPKQAGNWFPECVSGGQDTGPDFSLGQTHLSKQPKLALEREHVWEVAIDEFYKGVLVAPHDLAHGAVHESTLVKGGKHQGHDQLQAYGLILHHHRGTLQSKETAWVRG